MKGNKFLAPLNDLIDQSLIWNVSFEQTEVKYLLPLLSPKIFLFEVKTVILFLFFKLSFLILYI